MKLEEELRRAMAAHVAEVHASPAIGARVRRRHRRVVRFRAASAALVTAVAVGAVPVYLALNPEAEPATGAASGAGEATGADRVRVSVAVPDVRGRQAEEAVKALRDAGLAVEVKETPVLGLGAGTVVRQEPAAGTELAPGSTVTIITAAPPETPMPRTTDLGDLGDARAFGRVKVGYLAEGLRWSGFSLAAGDAYTVSYDRDGDKSGPYYVQLWAHEGEAVRRAEKRWRRYVAEYQGETLTVAGRPARTANLWPGEDGGPGTPGLCVTLAPDLVVEVMISPRYAKELGGPAKVRAELTRIAAGLEALPYRATGERPDQAGGATRSAN